MVKAQEGSVPSEIDWARMAAYLDGEGCIGIVRNKQSGWLPIYSLRIDIGNTDFRLPVWCFRVFGGKLALHKRQKPNHRDVVRWVAAGPKAAEILRNCLPFFVIKREQAELGLRFMETFAVKLAPAHCLQPFVREERESLFHQMAALKRKESSLEGVIQIPEPAKSGKEKELKRVV